MTTGRKGLGSLPLTALSAAAVGGATAFFCLAMPAPLFEALVRASGLPDLLPAARPPLGTTARALFAAAAALSTGPLTALLLVILGPPPRRQAMRAPRYVPPVRSETYPETWPRRPLSMEADIGAPIAEPAPFVPEPAAFAPDPAPFVAEAEWQEIEIEAPDPAPDPVEPPMRAPMREDMEDPISALMERLDAAVARKMAMTEPAKSPPAQAPELDDDHLRATLAELQRLAMRGR